MRARNLDRVAVAWFAVCAVVGIAWLCLLAWAVIALVGWVTHQ